VSYQVTGSGEETRLGIEQRRDRGRPPEAGANDRHAKRVLIVDTRDARASLAAVRGLGRAGWITGVGAPSRGALAARSRWARHWHEIPPPERGLDAFLRAVGEAVSARGYEVVFASSDAEILILARERERVPASVPYPPYELMIQAMDKLQLARMAERVGLRSPETANSGEEARARWGARPVVVKERLHGAVGAGGLPTHLDPLTTTDPDEIDRRAEEIAVAGGTPLIQELVAGRLMAFTSVVDEEGRMVARVQQEADRTYPKGMGCSVRAQTVPVDEDLAAQVARLLEKLGWSGLSELQFIVPEQGEPRLIDFNGRFYGSMSLALAAGSNLPALWAAIATGRPIGRPAGDAVPGVRYQWFEGDLRAACERPRALVREVGGCLRYALLVPHRIRNATDPLPAIRTAASLITYVARKAVRRVRRRG
jgi:predicted ATP-grasp superfamily ATP-dependent carboligase